MGILTLWTEDETTGVLPLMSVSQPSVLDYHELNEYVSCHSSGEMIGECSETICKWRQMIGASTMEVLGKKYGQNHLVPDAQHSG